MRVGAHVVVLVVGVAVVVDVLKRIEKQGFEDFEIRLGN